LVFGAKVDAQMSGTVMRFIDLFCGVGGFRVALESQGLECAWSCDIDVKAQKAYKANFGDTPVGDITKIATNQVPPHDVLCAGFPCQSFSISGKHKGIADPRGQLFYDIIRIAKKHKPDIMLLENVKNILTMNKSKVIKTIKSEIKKAGYEIHYHVSNASFHGMPQKRERVYFVCLRKGSGLRYNQPKETYQKLYLEDVLMSSDRCKELIIHERYKITLDTTEKENELKPIRIGHVNKAHQGERIYSIKGHSVTLAATTGGAGANTGLYWIDQQVRRLHINECKTIMGFPESHKVSDGREGYKQLGNAVMPPMIAKVYSGITP